MAWDFGLGDIAKVGGATVGTLGAGAGYQSMQDINAINRMAASGNYGVGNRMPQSFMNTLKGAYTPSSVFQKTGYPTGLKNWFTSRSSPQHFGPVEGVMKAGSKLKNLAGGMGGAGRYGLGALRLAGLTNPVGAAAMSAYAAPKLINALTERDPNATETRFGLNIQDLEDKAAAYDANQTTPGATLNDWGFPSGDVPVAGDDIQEQITETETIDPRGMRGISGEVGEYGDRPGEGFNEEMFYQEPGMFDKFKGLFQTPPAKQKELDIYEQTKDAKGWGDFGDYKGNIWEGSGGDKITIADPITGETILRNKNVKSGFGSGTVQEMIDKKDAWIADRLIKGKSLSKALTSYAMKKGLGTFGGDQPGIGPSEPPEGPSTYGGPKTFDFDPGAFQRSGGQRPDKPGGFTDPGKGSYGPHKAQGGYMRSQYNKGGRVGILSVF